MVQILAAHSNNDNNTYSYNIALYLSFQFSLLGGQLMMFNWEGGGGVTALCWTVGGVAM